MAGILRNSRFVGVDTSEDAVARGQAAIGELGLTNARLIESDLRDLDRSLGTFDYIIAHGVYSWVPTDVRDALLKVVKARLNPQGVAYMSYNVLPGWHIDRISRDLMRFHVQGIDQPEKKAEQARAFLHLATEAGEELSTYRMVLEDEAERLDSYPDWFMLHDHMGEFTTPVYFRDFVEHAASHGLRFLTEADYEVTTTFGLRNDVTAMLRPLVGDVVLYQQYLDYLRGGRFRRTLLCHDSVRVDRSPDADRLAGLLVAAPVTARPTDDGASRNFVGLRKQSIRTDQPLVMSVLDCVGEAWPAAVAFNDLVDVARSALDVNDAAAHATDVRPTLARLVLSLFASAFLELRRYDTPVCTEITDRPRTTRVARWQAGRSSLVTNVFHRNVLVEEEGALHLLRHLDGFHSRADLAENLRQDFDDNLDKQQIDTYLRGFARDGLLIA